MAVWSTVEYFSVTAGICANARSFQGEHILPSPPHILFNLIRPKASLQDLHILNFPTLRLPLSLLSNITVLLRSFSVSLTHHPAFLAAGSLSYL